MQTQLKWGDPPIDGQYEDQRFKTRDHRGRKWPICGCPCVACLTAWIALGVGSDQLGTGPGAN
jgi:hypothetical protein